ncbi:MAG TPA: 3'(2'),5'-bisphosphate nucleotidase CysQ [Pelagibacterium sp.]|uniref:3'(2'),5'-bisphosphate nucleotidase CysQ n=1 Tax=Pelagibacterium sp. TaxID=1967288 RepID=UPI002BC95497|nr:3'(2'),5'-bisphosphate nucleotidase CysQ [Pelagibacterium sp.]HWJ89185.1 3'(2'),5'-bisphosphate nucleotidase CysQ [Pelagibacterium sp.]
MPAAVPQGIEDDIRLLRSAAVHAGIIALGFFRTDLRTWTKNASSPVSEADIAVDNFLANALRGARPEYGWLSEEMADTPERLSRQRIFVVDPIDGTRGFIRGEDSWTISLAVVEAGRPIAGVVYAPARDEMYVAGLGTGASCNGVAIRAMSSTGPSPLIPAPAAVHNELSAHGVTHTKGPAYPSLAYRLVQVAAGELDAAVARRGAQDWDIAGADIILAEAGARLEDACIGTPRYNRPDTRHAALAATADADLLLPLCKALRVVYGCPETNSDSHEPAGSIT